MSQITIIGLGPGAPDLLTRRADAVITQASVIYVSDAAPGIADAVAGRAAISTLEVPTAAAGSEIEERRAVAARVVELGRRAEGVVFATLGNPLTDEPVCHEILQQAKAAGLTIEVVDGISLLEIALQALEVDVSATGLQVISAAELAAPFRPEVSAEAVSAADNPFLGVYRLVDPTQPVLVRQVSAAAVPDLLRALREMYPEDYPVSIVPLDRGPRPTAVVTSLRDLASSGRISGRNAVYLAPVERLTDVAAFDTLRYIVARLRAPGGCPWDREQTFQSIKKHLIEETYEAVAALDENELGRFAEELGDVLLQVVMYAQFAREGGEFSLEDVLQSVNQKLIRRHPHVFGNVQVSGSAEVLQNWEQIKRTEKPGAQTNTFAGIPPAAPALMRAETAQSRATRHGWSPPTTSPDCAEATDPGLTPEQRREVIGNVLFGVVALARHYQIDPEEALRLATNRFIAGQVGESTR